MARFAFFSVSALTIALIASFSNLGQSGKVGRVTVRSESGKTARKTLTSISKLRLAMKMILQKQRRLERALVVRTKQLKSLQAKKGVKGTDMKLARRTVRKLKSHNKKSVKGAPKFKLFKATRFSRMKAAVKQAEYETKHLRRVLSLKTRELSTLKKKQNINLKTVSRADSMKKAVDHLKANDYKYGDTKFPEACSCYMQFPNRNSKCWSFIGNSQSDCRSHQCKATFVCTNIDAGLICMRKRKTSKIVHMGSSPAGSSCFRQSASGYFYVPYTHG